MTALYVRRTLLALLLSGIAATAPAGGLERYRVMLALQPGDDTQVITSQLAGTYRLRVEPRNATQPATMIVVASESSVEMLRRDRRVAGVERVAESTAVPGFGAFSYDGAGNITAVGDDTFIYDHVGRLKKATLGTNVEEYTYDRYGNLETVTTGTATKTLGVQASSNRMNQATADLYATYDARGNVTQTSAGATFAYDGTDVVKASTFDGANHLYLYTAGDERIGTITSVSGTIVGSNWTVRDPSGKVLRRFAKSQSGTWTWEEDYIYRDDQLLAAEVPRPEKTLHFHLDHLGTPRVITGNGGAQIAQHTYYPFGTELTSPAQDLEAMKFTGHERDAAAFDYMHARYYNAVMRRFLSVDPVLDIKEALHEPQLWNRYSYVTNNPLKFTDPDGRYRTFYKEKPMIAENLAMDKNTPSVVKYSVYATGGLTALATAFGGGLPRTFPVIDRFLNGVTLSLPQLKSEMAVLLRRSSLRLGKRKENRHEKSVSEAGPSKDEESGRRMGRAGGCGAVDAGSFGGDARDAGGAASTWSDHRSGARRADDEGRGGAAVWQQV